MSEHKSLRQRRPDLTPLLDIEDARAREDFKLRSLQGSTNETFIGASTDSNNQNRSSMHEVRLKLALNRFKRSS
jgi:hypothetical protein